MEMVKLILIILLLSGCSRELHTGRYIIDEVRGLKTVTFKGVYGDYHFPDPVNPGDTVYLKRVFKESKANVW